MKTRYSPLVSVKKNIVQKSEQLLQSATARLESAKEALQTSLLELHTIEMPQSGNIQNFLSARTLLDAQRALISQNEEWIIYAKREVEEAREQLKKDSIEFEKFNYLQLEEIKRVLKERKLQEAKELDEVALMTYEIKQKKLNFGEIL